MFLRIRMCMRRRCNRKVNCIFAVDWFLCQPFAQQCISIKCILLQISSMDSITLCVSFKANSCYEDGFNNNEYV